MVKKDGSTLLGILAWFTGVVVSLVVGFGMIDRTLSRPFWLGGLSATGIWLVQAIGWIIVITTLVSVVLAILKQ